MHSLRTAITDPHNAHVLLVDCAGHGDSDPVPMGEMAKDVLADSIEHAIDAFAVSLAFPLQHFSRVVGVGHSMGCTCLIAVSVRRPRLFAELVLYEPVLQRKPTGKAGAESKPNPMGARTLRRRKEFVSREEAFEFWVGRGAFAKWREDVMRLYVNEALRYDAQSKRLQLKCDPSYEAQVYVKGKFDERLEEVTPTVTVLYGSDTYFSKEQLREASGVFPNRKPCVEIQGLDHFGPMITPGLYLKYLLPPTEISRL